MADADERRSFLRRKPRAPEPEPAAAPPPAPAQAAPQLPLIQRPPQIQHHWLTVFVAHPGPAQPVPAIGARITIRPCPKDALHAGEPIARGVTRADGTAAFHLQPGRYAVTARMGGEARSVTVTLEAAGRATLLLSNAMRRVTLQVEVAHEDGGPLTEAAVDVLASPGGQPIARGATDERGLVEIEVPPGSYEVVVGTARVKTFIETDTLLRMTSEPARRIEQPTVSRYQRRARSAVGYAAPFSVAHVRDDMFN